MLLKRSSHVFDIKHIYKLEYRIISYNYFIMIFKIRRNSKNNVSISTTIIYIILKSNKYTFFLPIKTSF